MQVRGGKARGVALHRQRLEAANLEAFGVGLDAERVRVRPLSRGQPPFGSGPGSGSLGSWKTKIPPGANTRTSSAKFRMCWSTLFE